MIVIFLLLEYSCFTMILWCWRRVLRVPWTARRANQSIFKKINPEYSWKDNDKAEAAILWPPKWTADSLGKTLMLGKIVGRRRGWQRRRWLDGITDSLDLDLDLGKYQEMVRDRKPCVLQFMGSQRVRHDFVAVQQAALQGCDIFNDCHLRDTLFWTTNLEYLFTVSLISLSVLYWLYHTC